MGQLVSRGRQGQQPDTGFTLVEVVIAMFITLVVMTSLIGVLLSSLSTVTQAKQRQTATAFATQALERLRALPYDEVTLSNGSAPDLALQHDGGTVGAWTFTPPAAVLPGFGTQPLIVNRHSGRVTTQPADNVTYTVQTYVTRPAPGPSGEQTFSATVLVSWTSSVFPTGRTAAQRSSLYSPAGCLSTAQSPFAAPCQAYFTAQSGTALGGFTLTNPSSSTTPIEGMGVGDLSLELSLAGSASSLLVEQTASANADAATTGVRSVGSTTSQSGGLSAAASVDSDPSTATLGSQSVSTPGQTSSTRSLLGPDNTALRATPTTSDAGAARAAIQATGPQCVSASGSTLVTGSDLRPCSSSEIRSSGTRGSMVFEPPSAFGFSSLSVPLVTIGVAPSDSRSVAAQLTSNNPDACTSGTGPGLAGCAHAASVRSLGPVSVGVAGSGGTVSVGSPDPAVFVPATAWDNAIGLWTLTGFTETARAEEGTGARAPSYSRAGDLQIWNGTGYTTVALAGYAAPAGGVTPASQTWDIPPTTVTYTSPAGSMTMAFTEASVTVQRPQQVRTPTARSGNVITDCKTEACVSRLNGGSSVVTNMTVTVTRVNDGVQVARFGMTGNLGGLVAQATYKAAPNA